MTGRTILRALLLALLAGAVVRAADMVPAWPRRDAIQTWRVGSGLPHQRVQAVCQTDDGFLWVGTTQGLVRFDGVHFTRADLPGEPSVVRLAAGRGNRLWVGTGEGALLHGGSGRFETISGTAARFTPGFEILAEDREGRLWITTQEARVFCWAGGTLRDMTALWETAGAGRVSQIRLSDEGLPVANGPSAIWTVRGDALEPITGFQDGSTYHAPGRGGSYWVSDGEGVRRLAGGQLFPPVGPARWAGRNLTFGIEDQGGNLWLATGGQGILSYQADGEHRRLDTRDGLCGDFASCLFVDRQGNLWVGSDGGGLSRVTPALFSIAGRAEGLTSDRVTAVHSGTDGSLWIGTYGDGLNRFDGRTFSRVAGIPETLEVMSLADGGEGLWLGTPSGLALWRNEALQWIDWERSGTAVQALHLDREGILWVGQRTVGSVFLLQGMKARELRLRTDGPEFDVQAFAEEADGRMWIGTDGAGLFSHRKGEVEAVGRFSRVNALEVTGDGTLWVAAEDGLSRVRRAAGGWQVEPGWMSGNLHTLRADSHRRLWATDDQGICLLQVDARPARMTRFGKADGLPGLQGAGAGYPQSARTTDGRFWFATTAGATMADPLSFPGESPPPPVLLEALRVNGRPRWMPGEAAVPVFHSGDRGFEFLFTAIDLRYPEWLGFAARIDGVDGGWRDLGGTHAVFHASLPPGPHLFRVKARSRSGSWSEERTLAFQIMPPLWQTGWFVALVTGTAIALAAGAAWLTAHWRVQQQLAVLKVGRALEAERSRIARDIHDQLGSGLTEIAFLGETLRMESGVANASGEAAEISSRARELTRAMDETVWVLNPENDTFEGLVSYLGHAMPVWLRPGGISCRLDFPEEALRFGLSARVRRELYLACKEAVHNAVKHSGATTVTLRIEKAGADLLLTLSDDGCGFDPESTTFTVGNGLANLRRRLADLGGTATIVSKPGCGTTVEFRLPLDVSTVPAS